ncbi:MAG: molybdenum cofactor biosynthesis protein MoaE [Baekduia sp.]
MRVIVRLFAMMRDQSGADRVELQLPDGSSAADAMGAAYDQVSMPDAARKIPAVLAVNREQVEEAHLLADGDELAILPPVSGGGHEPRVHAAITAVAPSADALVAAVADPGAGAIVTFHGVTREVEQLTYDAYEEMALPRLRALLASVAREHRLLAIAAEHRTDIVPLGEPSVIVAASAAHRPEAFAGARAAIDRIKAELPIWKREDEAGGERRWVEGVPIEEVT